MIRAARTLFALATAAGLSLLAACTSGTTADCSPSAGGNPDASAWCGVPAGDASVLPETGGPTETGAGDSGGSDTASGPDAQPEAATDGGDGGGPETAAPEGAADAPQG